MKNIYKSAVMAAGAVLLTAGAAGCNLDDGSDAVYTPAAYYQTVGGVNDCYYVSTPAEAVDLMSQGLCPAHSVPTLMPVYWEEEYYSYYSSPAYYDTYVPASYRSRYTSVTITMFKTKYSKQISTASSKAVYKSSTGGTVTGNKVATKSFGSGSRTTKSYGGGSRSNSGTTSKSYGGYSRGK